MSASEWMLLEHLLPLAIWLHLGPPVVAPHLTALALLGLAVAAGVAAVVAHLARRQRARALDAAVRVRAGAAGKLMPAPSSLVTPRRQGIAAGGRGARAPGRGIRRFDGLLLSAVRCVVA